MFSCSIILFPDRVQWERGNGSSGPGTGTASARSAHRPGPLPAATLGAEQNLGRRKWLMGKSESNCKHEIKFPLWMTPWVSVSSSATKQLLFSCSSQADNGTDGACATNIGSLQLPTRAQLHIAFNNSKLPACHLPTPAQHHTYRQQTELLFVPFQRGKYSLKIATDPCHSKRKSSLKRKSVLSWPEKNHNPLH